MPSLPFAPPRITIPATLWQFPEGLTSLYPKAMVTVRPNGFIEPCIPTRAVKPPAGSDWVHEIKHDGHRLIVRRDGETVRLFTRRGYDWTGRYPAIARAAAKPKNSYPTCGELKRRSDRAPSWTRPFPISDC
jgi:ATP dependent DNA ligase domain